MMEVAIFSKVLGCRQTLLSMSDGTLAMHTCPSIERQKKTTTSPEVAAAITPCFTKDSQFINNLGRGPRVRDSVWWLLSRSLYGE